MSATSDAATCMACRGTGKVQSSLGGTPHAVTCPWCQGTGRRIPGIDAQEHPSEGGHDEAAGAAPADAEAIEKNAASEDDDLT
jgi:DnaJ-class molecular chaperone